MKKHQPVLFSVSFVLKDALDRIRVTAFSEAGKTLPPSIAYRVPHQMYEPEKVLQRAAVISQAAIQAEMSDRLIAAAINSGNKSGVQAKAGIPNPARAEATL